MVLAVTPAPIWRDRPEAEVDGERRAQPRPYLQHPAVEPARREQVLLLQEAEQVEAPEADRPVPRAAAPPQQEPLQQRQPQAAVEADAALPLPNSSSALSSTPARKWPRSIGSIRL